MTRHTAFRSLAAAATLAASALLAGAPAEAGGGTRLNFGGPLGTFVATPTPGYGSGSASRVPRKSAPKVQHAKHPPANPAERPRATVARVKPARAPAPTLAKASERTGSVASTPVKVTHTLTAAELPRSETVADTTPAEAVATTTASEGQTGSLDAGSVDKADEAPAAAEPVETGPVGCRKFIPSVGVTVTVSCE